MPAPESQQRQEKRNAMLPSQYMLEPCLQLGDILSLVLGWEGHDNGDETLACAALRTDHLHSKHP